MGRNDALKREAIAALEAGGVLAFGVSEKQHGSDLLGNEFTLRSNGDGHFVAAGSKYYIGNSNAASIIAVLAGKQDGQTGRATNADGDGARRTPPVLFALRPGASPAVGEARKIRTLGVRAAFVGAFDVAGHEVPERDVIAEGRDAWHAVIGTVTLGRFFLGFGSIGICEHAMAEAVEHVSRRTLYRRPVIDLPHIRTAMSRAYTRLAAMKLFAYRALDYVHAASATDRRYLLFTAVQKAKVSTDGVKVMALISECVGARGFEADTYIEMALRDIQLIPGLEGSTHLNLKLCTQFLDRYLEGSDQAALPPRSLGAGQEPPRENPYLMNGSTAARGTVAFAGFLDSYQPLRKAANVRRFARQAAAFRRCIDRGTINRAGTDDVEVTLLVGQCLATIAYAQLIAESVTLLETATPMVSALFDLLVGDLTASALALASLPQVGAADRRLLRGMVAVPQTTAADWAFAAGRMLGAFSDPTPGPSSR